MVMKNHKPQERRCLPCGEFRAEAESRKITGYAALFEVLSEELYGFREKIRQGAFKKTLEENSDVRMLWNHNTDEVLGRTSAGTLALKEDVTGLWFEANLPETAANRLEAIQRHDVTQMSFGFRVVKDEWTHNDGKELDLRELLELQLFEISPVAFPAYEGTRVQTANLLMAHVRVWDPGTKTLQAYHYDAQQGVYYPDSAIIRGAGNANIENAQDTSEPGDPVHSQAVEMPTNNDGRRRRWARQKMAEAVK